MLSAHVGADNSHLSYVPMLATIVTSVYIVVCRCRRGQFYVICHMFGADNNHYDHV
jgi:hypothetical protein